LTIYRQVWNCSGGLEATMSNVSVRSDIAGLVSRIEVAAGAEVATGDTLLVIESMKMEIPVEAPRAGRVEIIHVGEGAQVEEDQLLVTLVAS
jgi:acetyl-CoA carboxylase biotin carboxyl carrier protein